MTTVDSHPPLPRLTLVELRKLIDTRAGCWVLVAVELVAALMVTADLIWVAADALTFARLLADAVAVAALLLPVLGILLVTSEWSQRTALVTFALVPRRRRVAAAKIAAGGLAGAGAVVISLGLAAAGNLVARWTGGSGDWSVSWAYVGRAAPILALSVLMGIAFGMALLNSALAIVVYLVLPTLWSLLGAVIPALGTAAEWLDTGVTMLALFSPQTTAGTWGRLAVSVAAWIALPLIVGLVRLSRQDVS